MKFLILSDLHLELASFPAPEGLNYDAVILAGDIHSPGRKVVHWARRESVFGPEKPIICIPGNHEFYGTCMQSELRLMQEAAVGTNVHVLDRSEVILDDPAGGKIRVLGCMLWTDFQLPIFADGELAENVMLALTAANRRMNDFRQITIEYHEVPYGNSMRFRKRVRLFTAEDSLAQHWVDRSWLLRQLAKPFDGATVVVTHHSPSAGSVHEKYAGDHLTPAFVSSLPDEAFFHPFDDVLWVHGHTHTPTDHYRKSTRIVSNPRGYRMQDSSFENSDFNPGLVIEVPLKAASK